MSVKERLIDKAEIYIVSAILAPLALGGFYAMMDARHDAMGSAESVKTETVELIEQTEDAFIQSVKGTEVRALKREKRKLVNYQRLAPDSQYSASREAEIDALTDEINELEGN